MITLLPVLAAALSAEPVRAVRGLAASVAVEYAAPLRARADQAPTSPILIRVSRPASGPQQVEFIGSIAGEFDLRDYLEREDGQPLAGLPPLAVTVVSTLPAGHGTDLFDSEAPWFNWRAHYRTIGWAAAVAWAGVPVVVLVWRAATRPRVVPAPPAPEPITLDRQLLDALERAARGGLSVEERGRLELLILRDLAARLGSPREADPAVVLAALRLHPGCRELVGALESWLHAPSGEEAARRAADALETLRSARLASPRPVAVGGVAS